MSRRLLSIITAPAGDVRNTSLDLVCANLTADALLAECAELETFRRQSDNLYARVRALFFLYAIHRFHLPDRLAASNGARRAGNLIPFHGFKHILNRRFEEAIDLFLAAQTESGPGDALSSALAAAYQRLAFQTLADQVRRSVRSVRGNQWMFRVGHSADHPLRLRPELLARDPTSGTYPILCERTPVRMDLTHSGWSDIFFLGMDYPEGARVLNVSIDLGVHGRDAAPRPPIEVCLRVIDEPVLRLTSVDLGATADIGSLAEVFDFAKDYLGLLKAAVIASGIVPPGMEGSGLSLADLLAQLVGRGRGFELVSRVNDIPKGSRLAVSTNLLAALVAVCMRATGQAASLTGLLEESERRLVLARALLGEWLGGSGGGWQDSGGVWPGMKLISGVLAADGDPESGVSRGRLMPSHRILSADDCSPETRGRLQESLVLVHGGMAQNVGPILEMVTEKYLLRCEREWCARQGMEAILDDILAALRRGDVPAIGAATTRNFLEPIQAIIPWATNYFTEALINRVRTAFGDAFWGFWMLGGMSGGGMGFIFAPERKAEAQVRLQELMSATKREFQHALPFAMEPVVYDFAINERGTWAELLPAAEALMPAGYYALVAPTWLRQDWRSLQPARRAELDRFGAACRTRPELSGMVQTLFDAMLPRGKADAQDGASLNALLAEHGFDRTQHEHIRAELRDGHIGLAQNRLPVSTTIEDVEPGDVIDLRTLVSGVPSAPGSAGVSPAEVGVSPTVSVLSALAKKPGAASHALSGDASGPGSAGVSPAEVGVSPASVQPTSIADLYTLGLGSLRRGEVAVFTLAAGAGSRWTQGAGVVKALHPFCKLGGAHRTFIETHLAKSRRRSLEAGAEIPHLFSTSFLTHQPIADWLARVDNYAYPGPVLLSPGRSIGLRLVPMIRDLRFAWEEVPQQLLDEQQQKVRDSLHSALMGWARATGEASDYTDNVPLQCLHPVGHWYEVPNLLLNGTLARLLADRPQLKYLLLHNIDTLGADVDPLLLGLHIQGSATLTFEVITRRLEDRGGGLARVNGRIRLVEGLALPHEEIEFRLTYYNSNTCWIGLDPLLDLFGLSRDDLGSVSKVAVAIRAMAARMPTYLTIKDVKKRWGQGQEDVFPVAQWEKLWVDMTALPEVATRFIAVPRLRGQQLKDQAQLDGWLRDGSAAYVENLCAWKN